MLSLPEHLHGHGRYCASVTLERYLTSFEAQQQQRAITHEAQQQQQRGIGYTAPPLLQLHGPPPAPRALAPKPTRPLPVQAPVQSLENAGANRHQPLLDRYDSLLAECQADLRKAEPAKPPPLPVPERAPAAATPPPADDAPTTKPARQPVQTVSEAQRRKLANMRRRMR